jgi:DNA-binding NarL/FixJ family response regulator
MIREVDEHGDVIVRERRPPKITDVAKLHDVLRLIAAGHENDSIAATLFMSENGVKSRVRSLLVYLGAANRAHAVHIGHQRGILRADTDHG